MIFLNKKKNNGFVLLFAVMLSSIILAIAFGVANIALKELNFSSGTRDANDAFFAADVGAECALANDGFSSNSFVQSGGDNAVFCRGSSIGFLSGFSTYPLWKFVVPGKLLGFGSSGLGGLGEGCAIVSVEKATNFSVVPPAPITIIISKGYSSGDINCAPLSNPNRQERQIQVTR